MGEHPVVDDVGAFGDVGAVDPDALLRRYVAPSGYLGELPPAGVDSARDAHLVPGAAGVSQPIRLGDKVPFVDGDELLVDPYPAGKRRSHRDFPGRLVSLHPPDVRRPRRYGEDIHYRLQLGVVDDHGYEFPQLRRIELRRREYRAALFGEDPVAVLAKVPLPAAPAPV